MDSKVDGRKKLIELIKKWSYREGDFVLASGKKSPYFIDLKPTSLHPDGAEIIGDLIVELVRSEKLPIEAVGGLTIGADPLATAVSLAAKKRGIIWPAFIVRKESKGHGTNEFVEGKFHLSDGAKVLVLEDVTTTGGSSLKAVERLKSEGYTPLAILTVVDREQGGRELIEKNGLKFLSLISLSELKF